MIKLIASDLDGTVLPEGTADINPEFYEVVKKLKDQGIIFCAATGREVQTMKNVMAPLLNDIYVICNNGGTIMKYGQTLQSLTFEWSIASQIVADIRKNPNVSFYSANTPDGTIHDSTNEKIIEWLRTGYGLTCKPVEDVLAKPFEALKISAYVDTDAATEALPYIEKYGDLVHVTAAGAHWIDFIHLEADKGISLTKLRNTLGIKKEETWAFGDNANDITMLQAAGVGFAAPGARDITKEAADICLEGSLWDAVVNQLKTLIVPV